MDPDPAEDALIDQIVAVLADGPFPLDDLTELLAEGGYLDHLTGDDVEELADQLDDLLSHYDGFWVTANDVVALSEDLIIGTVFTHRVTAGELASGMLTMTPDLSALWSVETDTMPLAAGGELDLALGPYDESADDHGSLVGPDGWLAEYAPGDLLALRRTADGLRVEVAGDVGDGAEESEALERALVRRVFGPDMGEEVFVLVLDAIAESEVPLFCDPVRPLVEILHAAGLEHRGAFVGPIGVEWQPPAVAVAEAERVMLAERYQLDLCCLELLDDAMEAWNELTLPTGHTAVDWRGVARALSHGFVAPAFADYVLRDVDELHPVLSEFVQALRAAGSKAEAPAAYLAARNLERAGDVHAAETSLQMAVRADGSFDPALEELAWYVADRGDAELAINLLRRSGAGADDPELSLLESMRPARNAAGRNDPCPCGSGRKYKDCCLRNARVPLERRTDWLLHKLWTYTLRPHRQRHVLGLALVLASDDDDLDELLDTGLPMDLAAFDDGLAIAFLTERGALLPDDERALLESWVHEPRALWEVVEHQRGLVLGLRETNTGRVVAISRPPDAPLDAGDLVYARVGSIDAHHRFVGVPIDIDERSRPSVEALIGTNPNAWDIARWFAHLASARH
jgi:hypothetical protein